jgi:hypothetical protein
MRDHAKKMRERGTGVPKQKPGRKPTKKIFATLKPRWEKKVQRMAAEYFVANEKDTPAAECDYATSEGELDRASFRMYLDLKDAVETFV